MEKTTCLKLPACSFVVTSLRYCAYNRWHLKRTSAHADDVKHSLYYSAVRVPLTATTAWTLKNRDKVMVHHLLSPSAVLHDDCATLATISHGPQIGPSDHFGHVLDPGVLHHLQRSYFLHGSAALSGVRSRTVGMEYLDD